MLPITFISLQKDMRTRIWRETSGPFYLQKISVISIMHIVHCVQQVFISFDHVHNSEACDTVDILIVESFDKPV